MGIKLDIDGDFAPLTTRVQRTIMGYRPQLAEKMRQATNAIKRAVAGRIRSKSGRLVRSLLPQTEDEAGRVRGKSITGLVGIRQKTAPYGPRLERGGPFYIVRPKTGKALSFSVGGTRLARGQVVIPEFEGRFFVKATIEEKKAETLATLVRAFDEVK